MKQNWIKIGMYIILVSAITLHKLEEEHSENEPFFRIEFPDSNQYTYTGSTESVIWRYQNEPF
jgi:hypothetical protein